MKSRNPVSAAERNGGRNFLNFLLKQGKIQIDCHRACRFYEEIHDHGNKEKYCGQSRISLCGAGSLFYYAVSDSASDPFVVHDPVYRNWKSRFLQSDPAFGAAGIPKLDVEYY